MARPAGGRAEFWPRGAAVADAVGELRRERPTADASAVRLGDAEHVVQVHRADAGTRRRRAGDAVRGGYERIGAVVDVE
jgi:hypothetical protein